MNLELITSKEYTLPINIPQNTDYKYLEVIQKGYAKYLEAIDLCGRMIMFKQFYELVDLLNKGSLKNSSRERIGLNIIKRLTELGFVDSHYINRNKFLYLKRPAIAIVSGNYNSGQRVNLDKDLKNDKFQVSILKAEYLLKYKEFIHGSTMLNQLKDITKHIHKTAAKSGNIYGYSLEVVEEILSMDDYLEIINCIKRSPEHRFKLGIIRGLWQDLGMQYRKMLLHKQTISRKPSYYKLFIKKDGEIILHYIPNVIIFDVAHDASFYREKAQKLFHAFYGIQGNSLREVQKYYLARGNMGYQGEHHIGYKITLIGSDELVLNEKKNIIDSDLNESINSPLMGYTHIITLNIGHYLYHASHKRGSYFSKQEDMINNIISKQVVKITSSEHGEISEKI